MEMPAHNDGGRTMTVAATPPGGLCAGNLGSSVGEKSLVAPTFDRLRSANVGAAQQVKSESAGVHT